MRLQIEVKRELLPALVARVRLLTLDLTKDNQISWCQKCTGLPANDVSNSTIIGLFFYQNKAKVRREYD